MDKQHGDSNHRQLKDRRSRRRTTATKAPLANEGLALRPRTKLSDSCVEEEPMRSEMPPAQQHMLNQRGLENLNIHSGPTPPAHFASPDIVTSRGKSNKRSAATAEPGEPQQSQPQRRSRRARGSGSDECQLLGGGSQPTPSRQTKSNEQHSTYPAVQSYAIYNYDPPVKSATRIRPPQQNNVDSGLPALGLDTAPPHLFSEEECQPEQGSFSAELGALLQTRAASLEHIDDDPVSPSGTTTFREIETRQIAHHQLVSEVRRIYDDLLDVEILCRKENDQVANLKELTKEQWIRLVNCHRALLHEHHDFYLASQHPTACKGVLGLAAKHHIPSRLWRNGIYSLLEIMRSRLPNGLEHMIEFIHHAFNLMTLFVESVPRFKYLWIESLGDLARYRMSIEVESEDNKRSWAGVARYWYSKGIDENHGIGRLNHHLGIIAKPNLGQQLFFYTKSLVCIERFKNSKKSVEPVFDMALAMIKPDSQPPGITPTLSSWFVSAHAMLLRGGSIDMFVEYVKKYLMLLDIQIDRLSTKFRETGICLGNPNVAAVLDYGDEDGILMKMFMDSQTLSPDARMQRAKDYWAKPATEAETAALQDYISPGAPAFTTPLEKLSYSTYFTFHTFSSILTHTHNIHILPYVHLSIAFIWSLVLVPDSMAYIQGEIPWGRIATFLNTLGREHVNESKLESVDFPIPSGTKTQQLPEDFFIRGQIWTQFTYPPRFFDGTSVDDDERVLELPSVRCARIERCLWYGYRLASFGRWIELFDQKGAKKFRATPFAEELERSAKHSKVFGLPRAMPDEPREPRPIKKRKGG